MAGKKRVNKRHAPAAHRVTKRESTVTRRGKHAVSGPPLEVVGQDEGLRQHEQRIVRLEQGQRELEQEDFKRRAHCLDLEGQIAQLQRSPTLSAPEGVLRGGFATRILKLEEQAEKQAAEMLRLRGQLVRTIVRLGPDLRSEGVRFAREKYNERTGTFEPWGQNKRDTFAEDNRLYHEMTGQEAAESMQGSEAPYRFVSRDIGLTELREEDRTLYTHKLVDSVLHDELGDQTYKAIMTRLRNGGRR